MWVVIGAAGQLGRSLSTALTDAEIAHVSLTRDDCDISSAAVVQDVMTRLKPTTVVNAAAWTAVDAAEDHPEEAGRINEIGARNVAVACHRTGAQLVHISTDYVFDGKAVAPIAEDAVCAPRTVYGRTKRAGELAVMEALGEMSYVVRTAWLYSEHGYNFAKTMMRRAISGSAVNVVNDQVGQPTNAHDLATHIIDLVTQRAPHGIYHGTNSGSATWYEFARKIYAIAGADEGLVSATDSTSYPAKAERPGYSVLAHNRTELHGVPEMRPWESALLASAAAIRNSVENEKS